tara:strand:+ start:13100 stop:13438 length:339 start_codon:yes stop_codon:yes gene_type:complete
MQLKSFFKSKKSLSSGLICLSVLFISSINANELIYEMKFDNNKPINYQKTEKKSSVFLAPEHWQAGMDEKHVWVEPQEDSKNKFVFYARNGRSINNPNWAHKRVAGVRFFSW